MVASRERFNFKNSAKQSMKHAFAHGDSDLSNHLAGLKTLEINIGYLRLTNIQINNFLPKILQGLEDCNSVTLHLNGSDFEGGIYEIFDEIRERFRASIRKFEVVFRLEEMVRWSDKKVKASFKPRVKRDSVMFHT